MSDAQGLEHVTFDFSTRVYNLQGTSLWLQEAAVLSQRRQGCTALYTSVQSSTCLKDRL